MDTSSRAIWLSCPLFQTSIGRANRFTEGIHLRSEILWEGKMAITNSGNVRILKPDDVPTDKMIDQFREWLDARNISALVLKAGVGPDGSVVFEVNFGAADHAELFNGQFG